MVIHPMMYNTGTLTWTSANSATAMTNETTYEWETYYIEPAEDELPLIEVRPAWPIRFMPLPRTAFNKPFIRRFRGNNRGRHWDRKRSNP